LPLLLSVIHGALAQAKFGYTASNKAAVTNLQ
jgi:hypothetical protein